MKIKRFQNGGQVNEKQILLKRRWLKNAFYDAINPAGTIPSGFGLSSSAIKVGLSSLGVKFNNQSKDPVADAAWKNYLGLKFNSKFLPKNSDGSFRLPTNVASQIQIDTNAVKRQIRDYTKLSKQNSDPGKNAEGNLQYLNTYLDKLRNVYKGNDTVVNEYEASKGTFSKDGYMKTDDTPLNLLHNFTLKYNPKTNQVSYFDTYDFNWWDWAIPGKKFDIKGVVPRKQMGGLIPEITVYGKKRYQEELNNQQQKYLTEMAKYKQDSTQWVKANELYKDSLNLYNKSNIRKNAINKFGNWKNVPELLAFVKTAGEAHSIKDNNIHPVIKPTKSIITTYAGDITPEKENDYQRSIRRDFELNLYKKPQNKPVFPIKPSTPTKVNYDPKYENLQMRSLWANIAKQNTSQNIGTLQQLDPLFKNGFNINDAIKFPQEIKDKYNIDYIYNQINRPLNKNKIK